MVTQTVVVRYETEKVKSAKGWVLIYGRRKVGKTFLVRNHIDHDLYMLVKRGGGALIDGGPLASTDDYHQVMEMVSKGLVEGKTVVVDEFHRLPEEFIESLQMVYPKGKLYLLGSSMHVARELMSKNSPLLGLLSEVKISLLSPVDILSALSENMSVEDAITLGPYLRDPWAIKHLDSSPERTIRSILEYSRNAIPALMGEVFLDEDRFLSDVYEAIVRSIASGRNTLKEVSDQLFSRGLIDANDPSRIRPYVKNMERMDIIEMVPFFNRRGYHYSIRPKIMELYYYLEERYGLESEEDAVIRAVIEDRVPIHVESFLGELMADLLGGVNRYHVTKDFDIDILITKRNTPIFVGEVKWKKKVGKGEVFKFLNRVQDYSCPKAIISKTPIETEDVDIYTPERILAMVRDRN